MTLLLQIVNYSLINQTSPAGMEFARTTGDMSITNQVADNILQMPLFYGISDENMEVYQKYSKSIL